MQTFLPFSDFKKSFKVLDYKRLGKQRVEALQLLNILSGVSIGKGWTSHPALKMWVGYEEALKYYANLCIAEWINRGYKNTIVLYSYNENFEMPWYIGDENFHRAMRARLIAKDEAFYLPKFPDDKDFNDGKYFWPVMETKTYRII
jgi:hypothetical protein